jgi:hypothetical protein
MTTNTVVIVLHTTTLMAALSIAVLTAKEFILDKMDDAERLRNMINTNFAYLIGTLTMVAAWAIERWGR